MGVSEWAWHMHRCVLLGPHADVLWVHTLRQPWVWWRLLPVCCGSFVQVICCTWCVAGVC